MTIYLLYAFLLFAALGVVPRLSHGPPRRSAWYFGVFSLALALVLPRFGAFMAIGWVVFAGVNAFDPVRVWLSRPSWRLVDLLRLSAPLHLVVGAVWVCLALAGYRLDGQPWIITPLTAIHFHFAGFAAAHLTANALEHLHPAGARWPALGATLLLLGVPALAVGFLTTPVVKIVAALAISGGMIVIAVTSLARIGALRAGHGWIVASWSAILVSMGFSTVYAVGEYLGLWWLSIGAMIVTHGVLNAVVFAGCGAVGWHKALAR